MLALGSTLLGFGKGCGEKGVLRRMSWWVGVVMGGLGYSGGEAGASLCLAPPQDSECTKKEEEEKGHSEVVTHPTGGGLGGEAQGQPEVRPCPA